MIEYFVGILIAMVCLQQWHIHTLLNKLMSRNYYDYQITKTHVNSKEQPKIPPDEGPLEDLGYLG